MSYMNTQQAAVALGISTAMLSRAVWERRFDPPQKSPSGGYLWTDEDVQRAALSLRCEYKPLAATA